MEINLLLEKIFASNQVEDENGKVFELSGNIDKTEGDFIFQIIKNDKKVTKTLEVGCGYGISSLFICSALQDRKNAKHLVIDPLQHTEYNGIGIFNLKKSGCNFFEFIEEPSEYFLPGLAKTQQETIDFIFIDGWHTFDHTLVDLFYANRLLKIGGYVVVDDCRLAPVSKAVNYFSKYPAYKIHLQTSNTNLSLKARLSRIISRSIPSGFINLLPFNLSRVINRVRNSSMIALKKISKDDRNWDWYCDF